MVTTGPSSRDALSFVPGVAERLGHYVYALRDPRDQRIFYIGKGRGERVYQHTRHAKKVDLQATGAQLKLSKIREIHRAGLEVGVDIIRHGLSSEEAAYEVEAAVMDALRLAGVELSNVAGGHHDAHRGWQPLEELIAGYVAKPVDIRETSRLDPCHPPLPRSQDAGGSLRGDARVVGYVSEAPQPKVGLLRLSWDCSSRLSHRRVRAVSRPWRPMEVHPGARPL